jgi:predicted nuclease with RNAse H fold
MRSDTVRGARLRTVPLDLLLARSPSSSLRALPPSPPLRPLPASPPCLGVDLAGLPTNPSGIATILDGRLFDLHSVGSDAEIVGLARALGPRTVIAMNAPLTLPRGRCCLDDDCRCRHDPGTRSRALERQLARERVPILASALIKVLARRGIALAGQMHAAGFTVLEAYPFATLLLLGLPTKGKRSRRGRAVIHAALAPLVPGLDHPDASEHELDAVICALTADLWLRGRCRLVGDPAEGQMVVPLPPATTPYETGSPALRRAAESGASYGLSR